MKGISVIGREEIIDERGREEEEREEKGREERRGEKKEKREEPRLRRCKGEKEESAFFSVVFPKHKVYYLFLFSSLFPTS